MAKIHIRRYDHKGVKAVKKWGRKLKIAAEKDHRRMLDILEQLSPVDRYHVHMRANKNASEVGIAGLSNWLSLVYQYSKQITDIIKV